MGKINPNDSLNESISLLEQKRQQDFQELKAQLRLTGDSLKPANLIKGAVHDITGSSQVRSVLIKAGIGLVVGIIAKKLLEKKQHNFKNQFLGNAVQYGISFLSAKRNNLLKAAGIYVANQLIQTIRERRLRRRQLKDGTILADHG
ncbi:MAG TPA: hypothetical protein VMZ69_03155 [Saprospiraceae bacterium]|nr:hypothetical protein [Saprospiraceae bacterium]